MDGFSTSGYTHPCSHSSTRRSPLATSNESTDAERYVLRSCVSIGRSSPSSTAHGCRRGSRRSVELRRKVITMTTTMRDAQESHYDDLAKLPFKDGYLAKED